MKFESFQPESDEEKIIVEQPISARDRYRNKKDIEEKLDREIAQRREAYALYEKMVEYADSFERELLEKYETPVDEEVKVRKGNSIIKKVVPKTPEQIILDLNEDVKMSGDAEDIAKMNILREMRRIPGHIRKYLDAIHMHVIATGQNTKVEQKPLPKEVKPGAAEIARRDMHQNLIASVEGISSSFQKLAETDDGYKEIDKSIKYDIINGGRYAIRVWAENVRNELVSRSLIQEEDSSGKERVDVPKPKGEAA
jgi:hypothetical protein